MLDGPAIDVLIVDDDEALRQSLVARLESRGWRAKAAPRATTAAELAARRHFDVVVVDQRLPDRDGLELLRQLRGDHVDSEFIVLAAKGSIEAAVQAMKLGALDYLTKPERLGELELAIERAWRHGRLRKENQQLRSMLARRQQGGELVGRSAPMLALGRLIARAGASEKAILIQGESGTGKELVARSLHRHSVRRDKPLVVINCAALPEMLLESELFGHEKGAFTGAVAAKPGLFEVADGGTLFIDEIGEMPGALQAKLLRVLEDGSLRRVGSVQQRRVNVRLLAATNRNLEEEVRAGRFREDLYYRINVMSLQLPPLRERPGDVALLVDYFLGPGWSIEPAARQTLEQYDWPGNVRQLINAIERARILADDRTLRLADLPPEISRLPKPAAREAPPVETLAAGEMNHRPVGDDLASLERAKVVEILRRERGNKTRAARALGIDRRKLYRLLEKHRIEPAHGEANNSAATSDQ